MTSVLVTGGSGRLGRAVLERLAGTGHDVRAASRSPRATGAGVRWVVADLATGQGMAEAVAGVDVIVHLATAPYKGRYTAKVELGVLLADPDVRAQPVDVRDIAGHVAAMVERGPADDTEASAGLEGPGRVARTGGLEESGRVARTGEFEESGQVTRAGRIEEFGGPEVLTMAEAAKGWLRARGMRRPVLRVRLPGALGRAFRAGHLITKARPTGRITWSDYLAGR